MLCSLIRRLTGKRPPYIEVFSDAGDAYRVRIRGGNGEIMLSSEAYANESNARRAATDFAAIVGLKIKEPHK